MGLGVSKACATCWSVGCDCNQEARMGVPPGYLSRVVYPFMALTGGECGRPLSPAVGLLTEDVCRLKRGHEGAHSETPSRGG